MSVLAIVPVKPFSEGKSRLRDSYSLEDLYCINRNGLIRTLKTLKKCSQVEKLLVVCRDEVVLRLANEIGAEGLLEEAPYSLNSGLSQALTQVKNSKTGRVLIIPTDLPLLQVEDLETLFEGQRSEPGITLVPDHYQTGTNAVLLDGITGFQPQFGRHSFQKHTRQAFTLAACVEIKLIKNIQHDLDTSKDLNMLDDCLLDDLKLKK